MRRKREQEPEEHKSFLTAYDTENKSLASIYPGWTNVEDREATMVGLPASGAAYFANFANNRDGASNQWSMGKILATGADEVPLKRVLPEQRAARYAVLRVMSMDPTIDSAIKMHISNALSAKSDGSDSVFIKSASEDKEDKIVEELRNALMPIIEKDLNEWARKAAVYGSCFARVYGEKGVGITNVRCDYYTHPAQIQKYEKAGRLAGYTTSYQGTNSRGKQFQLLPPWTFVAFEIPEWHDSEYTEPINVGGIPVDLAVEDASIEGLVESQEYGTSLIATAYGPWMDLLDALCSLKMSRRNAARLERIISVNTGRLDPERAARYLDLLSERLIGASNEIQTQSFLNGVAQTVVNHVIPNFSEKGNIQIDAVTGTPDINGLEDVLFHVKRLGSAIGVDPSLLGFGDFMSGGLGDGGFFRMSVIAATKATLLRKAIKNGIQRLCELHVAYKYGKIFLPGECPWVIDFNAINTAIEREEQETMESRSNLIGGVIGAFATVDQEFALADKRELLKTVWNMIRLNEDDFDRVFPEQKAKEAAENPPEAEYDEDADGGE